MGQTNRSQRRAARKARPVTSRQVSPGVQSQLAEALRHHHAGQLSEAERIYREVLAADPNHPDALHLLGVIAHQAGRNDIAVELIGKAIAIDGTAAPYHSNLGTALRDLGRLEDAVAAFRAAIGIMPDHAEAQYNLGNALRQSGRLGDAVEAYDSAIRISPERAEFHSNRGNALTALGRPHDAAAACATAVRIRPDYAEAHYNLGNALTASGRFDDAVAAYHSAIRIRPEYAEAHANLGNALKDLGRLDDAIAAYNAAVRIRPDLAEAHSNLGVALRDSGRLEDAVAACTTAIRIRPDNATAWYNLGNALTGLGRLDDAVAAYNAAIRIRPDYAAAYSNLGNPLKDLGRIDDAIAAYTTAIRISADSAQAHSNLLLTLHYKPGIGADTVSRTARRFAEQFEVNAETSFPCSPDPDRRLRIGYVSADFRQHPVGYFLAPVLAHHDRSRVEVFCYSNGARVDDMTARLRGDADHWRSLVGLSDPAAASLVASDGIDILVDLSGHTAGNRLLMFARKPAPVQVTWMGYFGTTGLSTMDYIVADRFVAPEDFAPHFTETIWRLPGSWLCFSPPDLDAPIIQRPAERAGSITFANFNNNAKTSAPAIALWCRVLDQVPGSKLMLKTGSLADATARQRIVDLFAGNGIAAERLVLEGASPRADYLSAYNRVDVVLDPTPFGGGTTTAEALWMGVPVVTLRGETWVGRMGESILSTIGLPDLVAANPDEYVEIAVRLAADIPRLTALRSALRTRIEASAFGDGARFTRDLEDAFRAMWRTWCSRRIDGDNGVRN